jgi:hypothetical protein
MENNYNKTIPSFGGVSEGRGSLQSAEQIRSEIFTIEADSEQLGRKSLQSERIPNFSVGNLYNRIRFRIFPA